MIALKKNPAALNSPNPALVSRRAAQRLPRAALLLFCLAYVVPGLFGRDPWKNADITAFGYMVSIAQGRSTWAFPTVGGLPSDAALAPYWLGALFVKWLGPWIGEPLAARLPFTLLLAAVLMLTWYSTYYLARTEAAQPLPFAFGGEASPVDYARAIADGALLALIATLGLLLLGHETTPELAQLASASLYLYALAACPFRTGSSRVAVVAALPALSASGAPAIAVALGVAGIVICAQSGHDAARRFVPWIAASTVLGAVVAWALHAWAWRVALPMGAEQVIGTLKMLAWFMWPAWLLACWTLWRWRHHLLHRHIAVPLGCALTGLLACLGMGGSDRALMLSLPALAALASFALPTLQRSTAAAIDWFSVFFFSTCALIIWVVYVAMQTGIPAQPAANVQRLAPGFTPRFSAIEVFFASIATLAWIWLVKWRTGRHRHPLWKSLVLPASGVALCWLLLMSLWLPLLDYARSYRPLVERIARHVPSSACVSTLGVSRGQIVAMEYMGGWRVQAVGSVEQTNCPYLLELERAGSAKAVPPGWRLVARERRPGDRDEETAILTRQQKP